MKNLCHKLGIGVGVLALAGLSALDAHAQAQGTFTVSQTQLMVGRKFTSVAQADGKVVVIGGRETNRSSGRVEVLTITGGRVTGIEMRPNLQAEVRDDGDAAPCQGGIVVQLGGSENDGRTRMANECIIVTASGEPRGTSFCTEPARFTTGGLVEAVDDTIFAISGAGPQGAIPTVEAFECSAIDLNARGGNRGATAGGPPVVRAPIPTPVARASSESLGGKIFVTGGRMGFDSGPAMNGVQVYDAATDSWTAGASPLAVARFGHAMAKLDDTRILILGGSDGTQVLSSTEILDTQTGQLSAGPEMPTGLFGSRAVNVGPGKILVIGGSTGMADNDPALSTILEFSSN